MGIIASTFTLGVLLSATLASPAHAQSGTEIGAKVGNSCPVVLNNPAPKTSEDFRDGELSALKNTYSSMAKSTAKDAKAAGREIDAAGKSAADNQVGSGNSVGNNNQAVTAVGQLTSGAGQAKDAKISAEQGANSLKQSAQQMKAIASRAEAALKSDLDNICFTDFPGGKFEPIGFPPAGPQNDCDNCPDNGQSYCGTCQKIGEKNGTARHTCVEQKTQEKTLLQGHATACGQAATQGHQKFTENKGGFEESSDIQQKAAAAVNRFAGMSEPSYDQSPPTPNTSTALGEPPAAPAGVLAARVEYNEGTPTQTIADADLGAASKMPTYGESSTAPANDTPLPTSQASKDYANKLMSEVMEKYNSPQNSDQVEYADKPNTDRQPTSIAAAQYQTGGAAGFLTPPSTPYIPSPSQGPLNMTSQHVITGALHAGPISFEGGVGVAYGPNKDGDFEFGLVTTQTGGVGLGASASVSLLNTWTPSAPIESVNGWSKSVGGGGGLGVVLTGGATSNIDTNNLLKNESPGAIFGFGIGAGAHGGASFSHSQYYSLLTTYRRPR